MNNHDVSLPSAPSVRSLSFHAAYGCRRRGACCTSNWPIPIEADRLAALQRATAAGLLRAAHLDVPPWSTPADAPDDTPALLATVRHACVFFDTDCRIQTALGHDALPLACRQFPRVSLLDPRGVSVTLSHYCPTAAGLLTDDRDALVSIDDAPRAFPAAGEYVGLDARTSLPPRLRPDLLMDWPAWWECERLAVACLTDGRRSIDDALDALDFAIGQVRTWTPGGAPLVDHVRRSFSAIVAARARSRDDEARVRDVIDAVPPELRPGTWPHDARPDDRATGRFLAAHAFASWTAHLGHGLRAWQRSIEAAMALLNAGTGVQQADLLLRHLADTNALTSAWNRAEVSDGR